jgi:phosphoglycerate kinase
MKGMDLYVNDAFGTVHRAHASTAGCALELPTEKRAAGLLIQKEVEALEKVRGHAKAPYTVVIGGAKVSDKIAVITNLMNHCNNILIGGAMAYTFLKYRGIPTGKSKTEDDKLHLVESIFKAAELRKVKIYLPQDHICAQEFKAQSPAQEISGEAIPADMMGLDIGSRTAAVYADVIKASKTVFWNGPMGVFEWEAFSKGTMTIAQSLVDCKGVTVVGGGDSVNAVNKAKIADKLTHVSTGGGASLEFLEGNVLPGIQVLMTH